MNDIEILEEIKNHQIAFFDPIQNKQILKNYFTEEQRQAIENLIQRNKELEQIEKEHKKENGRLRDRIKKLEENLQMQKTKIDILTGKKIVEINNNAKEVKIKTEKLYKPRYKIQEKIKELEDKKAKSKIKKTIDIYVNYIESLKNLLEEF